jgi:branched-chain amino acid transport system permease protein
MKSRGGNPKSEIRNPKEEGGGSGGNQGLRAIGAGAFPFALFALTAIGAEVGMRATGTEYCLTQLTMALYYALVTLGLCLVMGYAGQVSLGHGAFFALGGYTSAVLTTHDVSWLQGGTLAPWLKSARLLVARQDSYGSSLLTVSPWAAFLAAMVLVTAVACLIGYPALRLRGHYLAMATLAFGVIVNKMLLASSLAGAADGINGVPEWHLAGGLTVSGKGLARAQNYYLACAMVLLTVLVLRNLVHSRVGRALQAIHDGETYAAAMGIDTARYKLKVFVLSALLAAMAGVFFTHYTGGISPSEAGAFKSVRYVALATAGGMGNLWGVAVMSTALNYCSLRGWFGSYDNAVFGALLILLVSLAPEGPLKPLGTWLRGLAGKRWVPRPAAGERRAASETTASRAAEGRAGRGAA